MSSLVPTPRPMGLLWSTRATEKYRRVNIAIVLLNPIQGDGLSPHCRTRSVPGGPGVLAGATAKNTPPGVPPLHWSRVLESALIMIRFSDKVSCTRPIRSATESSSTRSPPPLHSNLHRSCLYTRTEDTLPPVIRTRMPAKTWFTPCLPQADPTPRSCILQTPLLR